MLLHLLSFLDGYGGLSTRDELNSNDEEQSLIEYFEQLNNRLSGKMSHNAGYSEMNVSNNNAYVSALSSSLESGIRAGIIGGDAFDSIFGSNIKK